MARSKTLAGLLMVCGLNLSACTQSLVRPYTCEQIRSLKAGQSDEEVVLLLGEPAIKNRAYALPWHVKPNVEGEEWLYFRPVPRWSQIRGDQFTVHFAGRRLTWVIASRASGVDRAGGLGLDLWKDPRREIGSYKEGPMFAQMFPCQNGS
jgi:hypothetical protein